MSQSKQKLFYGWVIVAFGILVMGVTHGVVTNCFSLYILPVTGELGVSREAFCICQTIINVLYTLISFLSGKIYQRVSVTLTTRFAAFALPVAFFCNSLCRSLPMFFACSVAVGISVSFLSFLPFTKIISNWFEEKRGQAIGLCFMGTGVGGMVMSAVTAVMIDRFGWRASYRLTGLIMLALLVPITFFVLKDKPADMGLKPYGLKQNEPEDNSWGMETAKAVRTPSFAAIIVLAMVLGITSSIIGGVIITHLTDIGYSTMYASSVVSAYLGALALGKILLGGMYDKIGAKKGTLVALSGMALSFLGLFFGRMQWMHAAIILGAAFGVAASNVSYPVLTRYAFGPKDYSVLFGVIIGCNFSTSSFGLFAANSVYSATGSYDTALLLCVALCVIAMLSLIVIKPFRKEP